MSAHSHTVITPGCYRCDLNLDEVRAAEEEAAQQAAREAACPEHEWVLITTAFGTWNECRGCGAEDDDQ